MNLTRKIQLVPVGDKEEIGVIMSFNSLLNTKRRSSELKLGK